MRFLRLPCNLLGRDFIVGDIHGCYSALMRLLDVVVFNYSCDRLFSVGDVIDRGPDSEKCLQLIFEPWFFMVPGNHEKKFRDAIAKITRPGHFSDYFEPRNGGLWSKSWFDAESPELSFWAHQIAKLPYVISVDGTSDVAPFWVVHAELRSRTQILVPSTVQAHVEQAEREDIDIFQWERKLIYNELAAYAPALDGPIYCGHTPVRNPPLIQHGHWYMDGGAGKLPDPGRRDVSALAIICHATGSTHTVRTA
jgi:serine/threonine protein phosphatase 1